MTALTSDLRRRLENAVKNARISAEDGARRALQALAVERSRPHASMTPEERALRNRLRAHGRQIGDKQEPNGTQSIEHLVREIAYQHWHRMLFARFLAENQLLIEPESGVAITMDECEDLAREQGDDPWALAASFAQEMLPQIFRTADPSLEVPLPPETRQALQRLLAELPPELFTADDALGWTYQFWQTERKKEVNESGVKIGADELPAVTQLFTEPYMVRFLIHNTLGAWWAGKQLTTKAAKGTEGEEELRREVALPGVGWEYLRFVRDPKEGEDLNAGTGPWCPAAGTFDGWPRAAKELKILDPCCGSGHFLVELLHHLVPIRMAEEELSQREAVEAVLRDNLHGLELDERCCQIAAFALALAAWKMIGSDAPLPPLHIACCGIGPQSTEAEWLDLAERSGVPIPDQDRDRIKNGLLNLHRLFSHAPTLGSLIDPNSLPSDLIAADYRELEPYLEAIMEKESSSGDDDLHERAVAAAGMVKAAELLAGHYTLAITNVPYLGRGNQNQLLAGYCETHYHEARGDLATCFLKRCIEFSTTSGAAAMVLPQNWLFQSKYKKLRPRLLKSHTWNILACVGPRGFETISGEVVNIILLSIQRIRPRAGHKFAGVDVTAGKTPSDKNEALKTDAFSVIVQATQLENPDSRIAISAIGRGQLLKAYAEGLHGQGTFDKECFTLKFWEICNFGNTWVPQQSTAQSNQPHDYGATQVFRWEDGTGLLFDLMEAKRAAGYTSGKWKAGVQIWGEKGVAVSGMGRLIVRPYLGRAFDENVAVVKPSATAHLLSISAFCNSTQFEVAVKQIDRNLKASCNTLVKVPFDLAYWQKVAAEKYPDGLPEPESDDPTQWLFHGRPEESTAPLQVAVARLLGYRWPAELDKEMHLSERARELVRRCDELLDLADEDGLVCLSSVRGETAAADRLRELLARAYGDEWSAAKERELLQEASGNDKPAESLEDWLRDRFFEEHCKLFHHRPFIWHIWDGRKAGFSALVNYHRLAGPDGQGRRTLEALTYSYLGDWIERQRAAQQEGKEGADAKLAAALRLKEELEKILEGEPPYDIFVRWKPLHEQPIGWDPDINDGVRLNIRPFMMANDVGRKGAGILRWKPNVKWKKDRGKEPEKLRPRKGFPWFWGCNLDEHKEHQIDFGADVPGAAPADETFDGLRWNGLHYTRVAKEAARERAAEKAEV